MALYYDTTQYATPADLFAGLAAVPNFWDSTENGVLTKGDVEVTMSSSTNLSIAAGELQTAYTISNTRSTLICATSKGLIAAHVGSTNTNTAYFAVGCDKNDRWGGANGGSANVSNIVAAGLNSKIYDNGSTTTSTTNTQIVDLASIKGDYIFEDVRRVLYAPSAVVSYNGKLTMPNGEKYVKCGAFVLRYTE